MLRKLSCIPSFVLTATSGAVVFLVGATASAATPTYYNNDAAFQAELSASVVDTYNSPPYVNIQNNAQMSAVLGETEYESTGHNNINIVNGQYYCAGCNGSFLLTFTSTSVGTPEGVQGVGLTISVHSQVVPYFAFITFADGTTADIALPAAGSYWAVTAPERIQSIHFGLSGGAPTTGGGFGIDNLRIGDLAGCSQDEQCPEDDDPCTDAVCNDGECGFAFNTAPCDDGNLCTELDTCSEGSCVGSELDCNDDDVCSADSCDMVLGCVSEPIEGCCASDDECGLDEVCDANACVPQMGDGDGDEGDGDGDDEGDGDGDSGDGDGEGDGDGDPSGDGDGDPSGDGDGDGDGDPDPTGDDEGDDEAAGDGDGGDGESGETGSDSGGASSDDGGCNCSTQDQRGAGALFGLLGLALLGIRRRRD